MSRRYSLTLSSLKQHEKSNSAILSRRACLMVQDNENTRLQCRQYPSCFGMDDPGTKTSNATNRFCERGGFFWGQGVWLRRKERPLVLKVQIAKKSERRGDDKYACVGMEDPGNGGKALYKLACRQSVHDKCREPPTHHPGPKTLTPAAPRASRLLYPPTARKTLRRRHESSIGVPEAPR